MTWLLVFAALPSTSSKWRMRARSAMCEAVAELPSPYDANTFNAAMVTAAIDAAYPFGAREMHPYKAWLQERRALLAALKPKPEQPTAEDAAAVLVARDALQEGNVGLAERLLAEQAPRALNRACPACKAPVGKPCVEMDDERYRELIAGWQRGGLAKPATNVVRMFKRESMVPIVVPHRARVGTVDDGPLFGGGGG